MGNALTSADICDLHAWAQVIAPDLDGFPRFWGKVDVRGPSECWPWKASTWPSGYGQFRMDGRPTGAHRVAYAVTRGDIPAGLHVLHRCDNPPCVNPNHLE